VDRQTARAAQKKAVQALETLSRILEEQHDLQAAIERATALVAVDPVANGAISG
jgi:hypothetical protein